MHRSNFVAWVVGAVVMSVVSWYATRFLNEKVGHTERPTPVLRRPK